MEYASREAMLRETTWQALETLWKEVRELQEWRRSVEQLISTGANSARSDPPPGSGSGSLGSGDAGSDAAARSPPNILASNLPNNTPNNPNPNNPVTPHNPPASDSDSEQASPESSDEVRDRDLQQDVHLLAYEAPGVHIRIMKGIADAVLLSWPPATPGHSRDNLIGHSYFLHSLLSSFLASFIIAYIKK